MCTLFIKCFANDKDEKVCMCWRTIQRKRVGGFLNFKFVQSLPIIVGNLDNNNCRLVHFTIICATIFQHGFLFLKIVPISKIDGIFD